MPAHIGHALSRLALERASLPVTICGGRVKNGAQFLERVRALAAGLRENLDLQCGDRVAIVALNSDLYLEWLLAVPCAGGIIAPLNYRWSTHEACEAVRQIQPVLLVVDQHCAGLGSQCKQNFPTLPMATLEFSLAGAFNADTIPSQKTQELELLSAPDGVALICFTSGTTGKPKGAAISHNALIVQSLAKIAIIKYHRSDVYLHTSPLCHIGGISSAHAFILVGGCHVFLPKFHALEALHAIEQHGVTAMIGVPAMLKDLTALVLSSQKNYDLCSMKTILNGAGSLSLDLLKSTVNCFPSARIMSAYGMTEACSSMSFMCLHDPKPLNFDESREVNCLKEASIGGFCVGKPAPHVELIVCANPGVKGHRSCLLQEGDVLVRGPHMMERYWEMEDRAFDEDQWFHTDDMGWMDHEGQLWLLGRRKDVIKSGGENVHCYEVEEIVLRHPGVAMVAVAGVVDVRLGEMVGAMVSLKDDWKWEDTALDDGGKLDRATCSSDGLARGRVVSGSLMQTFCSKQGLSRYKIPKLWCQKLGPFLVTSTGKVRKDVVRQELAAFANRQSNLREREAGFSRL